MSCVVYGWALKKNINNLWSIKNNIVWKIVKKIFFDLLQLIWSKNIAALHNTLLFQCCIIQQLWGASVVEWLRFLNFEHKPKITSIGFPHTHQMFLCFKLPTCIYSQTVFSILKEIRHLMRKILSFHNLT